MSTETATRVPIESLDIPKLETELNDQNPWPGLEGYQEGDEDFFKGRSEEIAALYRLIRRHRLTLLYGKAGTGKSSLLRAGLFPKQRREEALPVWVRLDHSADAPSWTEQVKSAIYSAAQESGLEAPAPTEDQSLWEYLHLKGGEFWTRHHRIIMPFVVFDQFEELFTQGPSEAADREAKLKVLGSALADLAEDRAPATFIREPERAERCNLDRHHYKLVVCIQEEYLAELDRMKDHLPPALFYNRMRLTDLTEQQAKEVVALPGQAIGAAALADEIVERASRDTQEQGRKTEIGVPKESVSPALLAVLCTTLNQQRLEDGAKKITHSHLESVGENILTEFYQRRLESLPEIPDEGRLPLGRTRAQKVNDRIADEFVDGKVRRSITPDRARTVFGDAALAALIADKVLGRTPQGKIELLHDVLPEVVGKTSDGFLRDWIERILDWVVPGVVAGLVVSGGLFVIGFEWGKRQVPEPVVIELPVAFGVPNRPLTVGETIALGEKLVLDLNEGTRRVRETVRHMDQGDFAAASVSLDYLRRFIVDSRPVFCPAEGETGVWEERVVSMLGHACRALDSHEAQWRTLDDLEDAGVPALSSLEWRDAVVEAWQGHETSFNTEVRAINEIVTALRAGEPPSR